MHRSGLSHKISICELIESFDDAQCLDVLQLFQQHSNCTYTNLNELLIKIIIKGNECTQQ